MRDLEAQSPTGIVYWIGYIRVVLVAIAARKEQEVARIGQQQAGKRVEWVEVQHDAQGV
jgi:hypothetical protein